MTTPHISVTQFEVIHFKDSDPVTKQPRMVILLYALGEDGILYEYNGGWYPLPIQPDNFREIPPPKRL
jgi:hypothetical protein